MADGEKKITCIPAKEVAAYNNITCIRPRKKRVAAYCRVSTDLEEQEASFEFQVEYYTKKILSNPDWVMAGIFADEGISGTQTKKRTEFLKLMKLCEDGKVDMILVKSVSRFARNTLDSLNHVRRLKQMGIAVIFEEENINSLEAKNELILTLYSSFAQAESESISGNITWAIRNGYKEGKVRRGCGSIMGYKNGPSGEWLVVEEEARVIRLMDMAFLSGMSMGQIKNMLEQSGIKSLKGNDKWYTGTITRMLQSEVYLGDVLLQKTFTTDVLTHKTKKNEGELPQYYIKDHHEAIRSREIGYLIQAEFAKRNSTKSKDTTNGIKKGKYSAQYALSEKLICGECGTPYRRVTWTMRNGEKKIVWRCISRLKDGKKYCKHSPTIEESVLHDALIKAINQYINNKDELRWLLKESINEAAKSMPVENEHEIEKRIETLEQAVLNLAELLSMSTAELDYFDVKIKEIEEELTELYGQKQNLKKIGQQNMTFENVDEEWLGFIDDMEMDLSKYNDVLVRKIVQKVTVLQQDKIEVVFVDEKRSKVRITNV